MFLQVSSKMSMLWWYYGTCSTPSWQQNFAVFSIHRWFFKYEMCKIKDVIKPCTTIQRSTEARQCLTESVFQRDRWMCKGKILIARDARDVGTVRHMFRKVHTGNGAGSQRVYVHCRQQARETELTKHFGDSTRSCRSHGGGTWSCRILCLSFLQSNSSLLYSASPS